MRSWVAYTGGISVTVTLRWTLEAVGVANLGKVYNTCCLIVRAAAACCCGVDSRLLSLEKASIGWWQAMHLQWCALVAINDYCFPVLFIRVTRYLAIRLFNGLQTKGYALVDNIFQGANISRNLFTKH